MILRTKVHVSGSIEPQNNKSHNMIQNQIKSSRYTNSKRTLNTL